MEKDRIILDKDQAMQKLMYERAESTQPHFDDQQPLLGDSASGDDQLFINDHFFAAEDSATCTISSLLEIQHQVMTSCITLSIPSRC